MTGEIVWDDVWQTTAAQLDQYRSAGLENLLTEDVLRFATIQQLVAAGVSPVMLEVEWGHSVAHVRPPLTFVGPT